MSIAGDVIHEVRTQKKISQKELAEMCPDVDVSSISRFENGKTEKPSREALMQILDALELHPLKFHKLCQSKENESSDQLFNDVFKIGWGHCIWGAPLIIPIYESITKFSSLRDIALCSYGVYDENDELKPHFYQPSGKSDHVKRGPSFAGCFNEEEANMSIRVERWTGSELKTFTADDVETMYQNDQVSSMVIPNAMADAFVEHNPDLMRCASMMFTGEACTFLTMWRDDSREWGGTESEVNRNYSRFRKFLGQEEDLQLTIFYARGTVAEAQLESHLQDLIKAITLKNPKARVQPREIDLGNWNRGERSFKVQFEKEFDKRGIACFLGWEPQISWIVQEIRGTFKRWSDVEHLLDEQICKEKGYTHYYEVELRELLAHLDPGFKNRSQHPIQFDMIISESAFGDNDVIKARRIAILSHFLSKISNASGRISRARNRYNRDVQYIASYLDMPPKRCLKALERLSFSLLYHPEWVNFTQQ